MKNKLSQIQSRLQLLAKVSTSNPAVFFKTGVGDYAAHDRFIGVPVPKLRQVAKEFADLSRPELQKLLKSTINEERLLALLILIHQYQKADKDTKEELYQFYMDNLACVNNWNLVDASAHLIVGAHIQQKNKAILLQLAQSQVMWERRIAIVATLQFIRNNEFEWTLKISQLLQKDTHDLIHKAVGWMLRETGKRDEQVLIQFLDEHAQKMPRTMLRYAIEKFPEAKRKSYLTTDKSKR